MLPKPAARQVAAATPATGMPASPRISGLTTTMYAMVRKVVSPAKSSVRKLVPWPLRSKNRVITASDRCNRSRLVRRPVSDPHEHGGAFFVRHVREIAQRHGAQRELLLHLG